MNGRARVAAGPDVNVDIYQLPIPDWGLKCPRCRYDLRGLPSHICPECGLELDMVEVIRPYHRLRDPRFTGRELPFPDFGLACSECESPLAGARLQSCPGCGKPFDPGGYLPRDEWFEVEGWMLGTISHPIAEMILLQEQVPHHVQEGKTAIAMGYARLLVPAEFFFEFLWLMRENEKRSLSEKDRDRDDEEQDVPQPGDWVCAGCGERSPDGFAVCWNCQTPRSD